MSPGSFDPAWRLKEDRDKIHAWLCSEGGATLTDATRLINGVRRVGCDTVQDMLSYSFHIPNLGAKSEAIVRRAANIPDPKRCPTCGHILKPRP